MFFGHRNFWLLFRILKLIYFPTIRNEATYVAGGGGCSEIVFLAGFRKSAPGLIQHVIIVFSLVLVQCTVLHAKQVYGLYTILSSGGISYYV